MFVGGWNSGSLGTIERNAFAASGIMFCSDQTGLNWDSRASIITPQGFREPGLFVRCQTVGRLPCKGHAIFLDRQWLVGLCRNGGAGKCSLVSFGAGRGSTVGPA
jgi:hypothetical protein